jgi:hypothetical protein
MKSLFYSLSAGFIGLALTGLAHAALSITHAGAVDPTAEGFTVEACCGQSTSGSILNDLGHGAWSITGQARSYQFGYYSGTLSPEQKVDIGSQGFILTLEARASQGLALTYDSGSHTTVGGAAVDMGTLRFEIGLGVDGNGDTVVVLPTSIDPFGPDGSIRTPGPSYTLTGSGSSYHTYQLVFNPEARSADLFVDGTERIRGYTGDPSFLDNKGLKFGAFSGGQINFAQVQLTSPVPEPSVRVMMGLGVLLLIASWRIRLKKPKQVWPIFQPRYRYTF